jgi:hypothetical protein
MVLKKLSVIVPSHSVEMLSFLTILLRQTDQEHEATSVDYL